MLSTLARGYGSWTGDLEVAGNGTARRHQPVLITSLSAEDGKFLEKSVNIPLRVKSAVGPAVIKTSSAQSVPSAALLVDAIRDKSPKTQYARPKSVCSQPQRPASSKEKILRSKSAAAISSKKSKPDLATGLGPLNSTSPSAAFAKYGTQLKSVSEKSSKSKDANAVASSADGKSQRSDGQMELPKTYMTRKGALLLFTAPENVIFSEPDQKCYFKKEKETNDIGKLSLGTLGTVNKLTTSVLQYGRQQQPEDDSVSDADSYRDETHMQFVHNEHGDQEVVDYRAQPGADFVFYLRDMQSRAVVRNLVRTPSQPSLASVDSAAELTAALQSIDPRGAHEGRGNLLSPDVSRLADQSRRWNATSAGSVGQQSRNALSRPSTSASNRSTTLSVGRLAASLKSSPYLGHPIRAPYPPSQMSYPSSPEPCPRLGSGGSRKSSAVRKHSGHSAQSRDASSVHSARSQRSQWSNVEGASQGSVGYLAAQDYEEERPGSEHGCSVVVSQNGTSAVPNDNASYHGNSIRSRGLSLNQQDYMSEGDLGVYNDFTEGTSPHDAISLNTDGEWTLEQPAYIPAHYYGSRPSTASHHTYISGTTSLPTTIHDSQLDPSTGLLDQELDKDALLVDHDALLVDHDALLVDHDALLLDTPTEQDGAPDDIEQDHSSRWPMHSGQDRLSPALSTGPTSPSSDRPPSQAKSLSSPPQRLSPSPSDNSNTSQGRALIGTEVQARDDNDTLPPSAMDNKDTVSVTTSRSPVPVEKVNQLDQMSPTEGTVPDQQASVTPPVKVPSPVPRLPARPAGLADVVNQVAEKEMGVPYTTLVPPKLGPSIDTSKPNLASVRRSPSPEIRSSAESKKPPAPDKKISKLDMGKLKSMLKPPAAKTQSTRTGRKSKGKGVRPKATGVQFISSLNIDSYQGPDEDEVERMVQEELSKALESSQLNEEGESMPFLVVPEEKEDDAVSLATDDEALEQELKKQAKPGKLKKSKKSLAKEKAELREARRQEKLRREEELKALAEKKKQREEEKRKQEIAEQRRIQMAKEELEDAAWEAERAAQEEEEARQMLQETRRLQREEREARRKAELEKRRLEKDQQRRERRKMEEAARLREQEMADRLANAAEKRRLREEAEWEIQERDRLEQEEREREDEEEKQRLEEEEERIREMEREAEEEAIARLVKEREEAEHRMRLARQEAERQSQEEERLRLEAERTKVEEEELQRQQEAEAERKRQEELERIRRIQKLEEDARERVQQDLARRLAWAVRRREHNQAQRDHLNSVRQTQGMTQPWVFSYYVHWPKANYERRVFVAKKNGFRSRPKPKPKPAPEDREKP